MTVIVLITIMAVVAVTAVLVHRDRTEKRRATYAATSTTGVTSPYDLTELPPETDLETIADAAFLSISLPNGSGVLTSYGVSVDLPAAQDLIDAITAADEVDPGDAASALGSEAPQPDGPPQPTLTFVLPTRETLTFALYVEQGMIAREAEFWRPEGDLAALVAAATAPPE
jgi:hypothetical protein